MNWRSIFGIKLNKIGLLCDHNPNSDTTTLMMSKMTTMTYPATYRGVCKHCGQSLEFTMDEKGQYNKVKRIKNK